MKTGTVVGLLMIVTTPLGGCGLSVSDEDRLLRAEQHVAAGEYRTASIEYKNVLAADPDNAKARVGLARVSLGLGDVLDAEKEIRRAADLGAPADDVRPLFLDVLIAKQQYTEVLAALSDDKSGLTANQAFEYRGAALVGVKSFEAAGITYRDWLGVDPGNASAIVGYARVLLSTKRRDEAIDSLEALLESSPDNADAWAVLGRTRFSQGEYGEAVTGFSKALEQSVLESDFRFYYSILASLADAQLRAQKIDDSRETVARLVKIAGSATPTLLLSARLAQVDQDYAAAARYLQEVLVQSPTDLRAMMFLADIRMRQNNLAQAGDLLSRVVARAPDNIQARKMLARVQLRQSEPSGVVETLAPLLNSGDSDIHSLIGQANLQQGNIDAAIENFRIASEANPGRMTEQLNLAVSYLSAGENATAIELLLEPTSRQGDDFRREELLIIAYMRDGQPGAAAAVADTLATESSDNAFAVSLAANFSFDSGDVDKARILYQKSLQLNPANIVALLGMARLEVQANRIGEAAPYFREIRELQPGHPDATLGLVRLASSRADTDSAYDLLQEAIEYHPENVQLALALAQTCFRDGLIDEALAASRRAANIGSYNPAVNAAIGKVLLESGAHEEALVSYEIAVERAPDSPQLLMALGFTYLALDRTVDAQASLARAVELDNSLVPAAAALILVELRQGRYDSASSRVKELRERQPDHMTVMLLEGEVYSALGDHISAANVFAQAIEKGAGRRVVLREYYSRTLVGQKESELPLVKWLAKTPEDHTIRRLLAERYQLTGSSVQAIGHYKRLLEVDPDNAEILNNLAWEHQVAGDLELARDVAERARELRPDSGSIADTLGWIYLNIGAVERSIAVLRGALELSPDNGEINYHLAVALFRSGQRDEARDRLENLLASNTQFPSVDAASRLLNELRSLN